MSVTIDYLCNGERLLTKLGNAEARLISQLASQFRAEGRILFDADALGEETTISAADMLKAATSFLEAVNTGIAKRGYSYRLEWIEANQRVSASTGMQCQINGIDHSVRCGRDKCTMQALYRDPDGKVKDRGPLIDLRGQQSFRSDSREVFIITVKGEYVAPSPKRPAASIAATPAIKCTDGPELV